ncbi:hypothetical protein ACSBR2_041452 [Camellia fascicularis]
MWMMGYSDGGELNFSDSFNGRRLRPLIPRPASSISSTTTTTTSTTTNPPCLSRLHGSDLLAFNHHLSTMTDQNKREFNPHQVVVSSRWNPTPEQLQTLEELYRRGTRTPSADQIQHITAQLRRYGKIEGKNVFYWFQNHKARERQKRRRQLESVSSDELCRDVENTERKESGANRTGYEVEQTKSWGLPTNCSTLSEKTASTTQRAAVKAAAAVPECGAEDGWVQFDEEEGELQQRNLVERNATWQMMQLSCSSPPTHLINPSTTTTSIVTTTTTTNTIPNSETITMDPNLIKTSQEDLNIFIAPYRDQTGRGAYQTLQLFPLRSSRNGDENTENEAKMSAAAAAAMNPNFTPYQYFEFLPLKN